ncbi:MULTISPECIES: hypothetical protein [Sphingomonas]|uniref:hypothetical protein n=1 Tax=Sphingomonas TaxID=13687 RepID=UPI00138EFA6C|nr:hypothetical protein [Sphingomonas sp. Leaf34]
MDRKAFVWAGQTGHICVLQWRKLAAALIAEGGRGISTWVMIPTSLTPIIRPQ